MAVRAYSTPFAALSHLPLVVPREHRQHRPEDLLALATRNRFLLTGFETFGTPVAVLPSPAFATSGHGAASLKDYADLLMAIERRDGDRAAELSASHMRAMARLQLLMMSGENERRREGKGADQRAAERAGRGRRHRDSCSPTQ